MLLKKVFFLVILERFFLNCIIRKNAKFLYESETNPKKKLDRCVHIKILKNPIIVNIEKEFLENALSLIYPFHHFISIKNSKNSLKINTRNYRLKRLNLRIEVIVET